MEFFDVINNRCSVRAFTSETVEDEKLQKILKSDKRDDHLDRPFTILFSGPMHYIINLSTRSIYRDFIRITNR